MDNIPLQTSFLHILKGRKDTYTLQPEPINNGAISQVFLGENNRTKKQVAIKEVLQETFRGKKQNLYYEQEFEISKYLMRYGTKLKYVVQIYDVVESKDKKSFYVIMEYLQEGDFSSFISNFQDSRISPYLPTIALHIANGIKELHDLNIIHRDIKPQNIFVKNRALYSFKIGDFGLCKLLPKQNDSPNSSKQSIVGTISYMAPEQFSSYYNKSIDVWSFGCLLYEASRGTQLFKQTYGSSYNDIIRMIQSFRRFNCKDSNDFIGQIISKCLYPAENRPQIGVITNLINQFISKNSQNGLTKTQLFYANQSLQNSMVSTYSSTVMLSGIANTTMEYQTPNFFQQDEIINETMIVLSFPKEAHLEEFLNQTLTQEETPFIQRNVDTSSKYSMHKIQINTAISDSAKRQFDQNNLLYTMNMSIKIIEEMNAQQIDQLQMVLNKGTKYSETIEQIGHYKNMFPSYSTIIFNEIQDSNDQNKLEITDLFPLKSSKQVIKELKDNPRARRILNMFVYDKYKFKDDSFVFFREFFTAKNRSLEYHLFIQALVNVIYEGEQADSCLIFLLNIASKETAGKSGTNTRYSRLCTLFLLILHKLDFNYISSFISLSKSTQNVIECLKQALLFNGLNSEISSFAQQYFPLSKKNTDFLGQTIMEIDPSSMDSMDANKFEQVIEYKLRKETSKAFSTIVYCLEGNQGRIFLSKKQSDIIFPHTKTVNSLQGSSPLPSLPQSQQTYSSLLDFRTLR